MALSLDNYTPGSFAFDFQGRLLDSLGPKRYTMPISTAAAMANFFHANRLGDPVLVGPCPPSSLS